VRSEHPFRHDDLEELHTELFSRAERVVPMYDVHRGDTGEKVIGLRHDVDDNAGSFDTALRMAEWEFEHGYSSTYYLLHTAYYWERALVEAPRFEELGHEVGIHVNALAEAFRQRREPHLILARALAELRETGVRVVGCVAHGDPLCRENGRVVFVNDEMFSESARPSVGDPERMIERLNVVLPLSPMSRSVYELEYDANWLPRGDYISDSGGYWNPRRDSFELAVSHWAEAGQLHILIHPDWWSEAFVPVEVAA
jgi:hypothetical protein